MAMTGGGARQGRDSGVSEGIGGSRRGERNQRECVVRPGSASRGAQWCGGCGERDGNGRHDGRGVARAWAWRAIEGVAPRAWKKSGRLGHGRA